MAEGAWTFSESQGNRSYPSAFGHPEAMKTIPLLGKEGSGVVAGPRGSHLPPPAPPAAEEVSHIQSSLFRLGPKFAAESARPARTGVRSLHYEPVKFSNRTERADLVQGKTKAPPYRPWMLPPQGLALFHGDQDAARLSHYFFPRLLLEGKRILMLDGANRADPRLLERLARQRRVPFEHFCRQLQIARAFTCFQLTELIARLPRLLADFPAQVVIVTAFPELYYDEDVRDWNAQVAFEQALADLRRLAGEGEFTSPPKAAFAVPDPARPGPLVPSQAEQGSQRWSPAGLAAQEPRLALTVAVFSSATTFTPSPARRRFFEKVCAAGAEVWQFRQNAEGRLGLVCSKRIATTPGPSLPRRGVGLATPLLPEEGNGVVG